MPHSFVEAYTHIIFSTKDRRPFLDATIRPKLFQLIRGICLDPSTARNGSPLATPIAINGFVDHVHPFLKLGKSTSVSDLVREIKRRTTLWMREQGPQYRDFSWQNGYAAFSVSHSIIPKVIDYIDHQEEHHRTKTFQEEYKEFLEAFGIKYDEKYLWD